MGGWCVRERLRRHDRRRLHRLAVLGLTAQPSLEGGYVGRSAFADRPDVHELAKHSGFGREGGAEGIEEYLETKYVAINL